MALHIAKPVNEKANQDAFTSWLGSHLHVDNESVLNQIDALSSEAKELDTVIREASEIILDYSEDFDLPSSNSEKKSSPEDLYQLLITEWNNYQNSSNGMGKAVFVQNAKPQTILPTDANFQSQALSKTNIHFDVDHASDLVNTELSKSASFILSPLKSGTAIGAP